MMRGFKAELLAAASVVALLASPMAIADVPGTSVTHTSAHLDAATIWQGSAGGAASCNAVSATAATDTITISPPGGQYVYLTEFIMQTSTDATGATEVPTISMTNIAGGGFPAFLSAASTLATTGYPVNFAIPFPNGLKSQVAGTNVTFVPSATLSAHKIMCNSVTYYTNAS